MQCFPTFFWPPIMTDFGRELSLFLAGKCVFSGRLERLSAMKPPCIIIPRFEHTWAAVQRTRTAHWIICLNPLISSCSNHSSLSMVKPSGGVKRPIDRSVRLEQMANKRIKAMC